MGDQAEWCGEWKCLHAHIFICSASLCLLVGTFNPFTFKVIIDMYDPITVFLIVLGLLSIGLFLLLCSLPREVPLAFVVKLVWWYYLSGKLLISPTNLNESLARYSILGYSFSSFINLNMLCHSLLACRISVKKSADNLMEVPLYVIFPLLLLIFNKVLI